MHEQFRSRNPAHAERVQEMFAGARFVRQLGIELLDSGPGWCESRLPVRDWHAQQNGFVHAGATATLADHTAGASALSLVAPDEMVLSVEFKINLLRPGIGEFLCCRGEVIRNGRKLIVSESEVYAVKEETRKLVAKATVTLAVLDASE